MALLGRSEYAEIARQRINQDAPLFTPVAAPPAAPAPQFDLEDLLDG